MITASQTNGHPTSAHGPDDSLSSRAAQTAAPQIGIAKRSDHRARTGDTDCDRPRACDNSAVSCSCGVGDSAPARGDWFLKI